jgi:hypothetical protein
MADLVAAVAAERVYESVDELARAMHGQLAMLAASTPFLPWVRDQPSFKPRLSGLLWTAQGPRRVTILLDTGATHYLRPPGGGARSASVGPAGTPVCHHCGGRQ